MLDVVAVADRDDPAWPANMQRALDAISESGAIVVELNEEAGSVNPPVSVDASNLLMPAIVLIDSLVETLARLTGNSRESVVHDARVVLEA